MAMAIVKSIAGPRLTAEDFRRKWVRYLLPLAAFIAATVLLLISSTMPYWQLTLRAPQYPRGLTVVAHLTHLQGDVGELNNLNHYIGMKKLEEGGTLERKLAIPALMAMGLLLVIAGLVHTRWAVLLALPALLFPLAFLADLQAWLYHFGNNLDKKAALSNSIKPFTPTALGLGKIGQFRTWAQVNQGFWLAVIASGLVLVGLGMHWWAYRSLARTKEPRLTHSRMRLAEVAT